MKKEILDTIKQILKVISVVAITFLGIIIFFLIFIVLSTKVCERAGKKPIFSLYTIISPSMVPNINVYDVVFVAKTDTKKLKAGDVISFYVKNSSFGSTPVTHRIVERTLLSTGEYSFTTKGDYNLEVDSWRFPITESDVIGKVRFRLPQLGRLQFFLTSKKGWFILILFPALAIIAYDLYKLMKLIIAKSKMLEANTLQKKEQK